jgi:hypothetical protein
VCAALQRAIELEHATIPLYLYALYSLDPNENPAITQIIQSVAVEEMLHMVLGANVLNAIGRSPTISKREFIPTYPGRRPGGVEDQLVLHLRPFSMDQLAAFIEVEEPRDPLKHQSPLAPQEAGTSTIGGFYTSIESVIRKLPQGAFVSPRRKLVQVPCPIPRAPSAPTPETPSSSTRRASTT